MHLTAIDHLLVKPRSSSIQIAHNVRSIRTLDIPEENLRFIRGKKVLLILRKRGLLDVGSMFVGKTPLQVGVKGGGFIFQFGHGQLSSSRLDNLFLDFFIEFPKANGVGVGCDHFLVLALVGKPVEADQGLVDFGASQGIELTLVGLELGKVGVEAFSSLGCHGPLEDDHSAGLVANRNHLPTFVKLEACDNIIINKLFIRALVTEYL